MDPRARATTWQLIRDLQSEGVTIVLTTHHMDEVEHLCDRLAILDHGRIVAAGSPAEVTSDNGERGVHFTTDPGLDRAALVRALGLAPDALSEPQPGEYILRAEGTPDIVAGLAVWLRDAGLRLTELRTERRTLEEVFLRLTAEEVA